MRAILNYLLLELQLLYIVIEVQVNILNTLYYLK